LIKAFSLANKVRLSFGKGSSLLIKLKYDLSTQLWLYSNKLSNLLSKVNINSCGSSILTIFPGWTIIIVNFLFGTVSGKMV